MEKSVLIKNYWASEYHLMEAIEEVAKIDYTLADIIVSGYDSWHSKDKNSFEKEVGMTLLKLIQQYFEDKADAEVDY